jgi:hypothetical protein
MIAEVGTTVTRLPAAPERSQLGGLSVTTKIFCTHFAFAATERKDMRKRMSTSGALALAFATASAVSTLQENGLCSSLPYVCPEPVLDKTSFLHIDG